MSHLYVPLRCTYYLDPKICAAGEAAEVLYVRGLGLAKSLMTDGFLADSQLPFLGLSDMDNRVKALADTGLWDRVDGGWQIRSWLLHNKSADDIEREIELKREAGRAGGIRSGAVRGAMKRHANIEAAASALASSGASSSGSTTGQGGGSSKHEAPIEPRDRDKREIRQRESTPPLYVSPTEQDDHIGNQVNQLWTSLGLKTPRVYDWLAGAAKVSSLLEHWSGEEVLSAVRRVAEVPELKSWVGIRGPAYLCEQTKGRQVIEVVLTWEGREQRNGRARAMANADNKANHEQVKGLPDNSRVTYLRSCIVELLKTPGLRSAALAAEFQAELEQLEGTDSAPEVAAGEA